MCIDIDGTGIHQEILRSLFPVGIRLEDLIPFNDPGRRILHRRREMEAGHDGAAAIIDKPVPGHQIIGSFNLDAGRDLRFRIQSHPFEDIVHDACSGGVVVGQDTDPAVMLEPAAPDFHSARVGDAQDIAPDGTESAVVNGRPSQLAGIEADQEIVRIRHP